MIIIFQLENHRDNIKLYNKIQQLYNQRSDKIATLFKGGLTHKSLYNQPSMFKGYNIQQLQSLIVSWNSYILILYKI